MDHSQEKSKTNIAVVNLGEVGLGFEGEPSEAEWRRVGCEVVKAFSDIGFVYITHHGMPEETIRRLHSAGDAFFGLPEDIKKKFPRNLELQHGYVTADREKLGGKTGQYELRESYDVKYLDGMFPSDDVPHFKSAAGSFLHYALELARKLLVALEVGLGLENGKLVETHRDLLSSNNATCLRILHYPPVPPTLAESAIRCGSHTDYGTITLLFQDNMGGLEVRDRSGKWIRADPLPGSILVNVGDLLQMWTADKLIATEHRVLIPKEEIKQRCSRRSVVLFVHPDDPVIVQPLDGSTTYPPVTAKDHVIRRFVATYQY